MKKYIVLSVNDNPDYLYFTPLTCWAWRQFGWEPYVMFHGVSDLLFKVADDFPVRSHLVAPVAGYRSDTITQLSRLYAANTWDYTMAELIDGYLMTSDIDMLPLSDYWNPDFNQKTVWGHDLTGYGHYPCCYVGMNSKNWREVMNLEKLSVYDAMNRDLAQLPQAKDSDFYKYWFTDQDLITERLKPYNPVHVHRGQYPNGLAIGRVDRANWSLSHSTFVDAHLHHQIHHKGNEWKFDQTMELLHAIWPEEDFGWFDSYHYEFKRLTGHA